MAGVGEIVGVVAGGVGFDYGAGYRAGFTLRLDRREQSATIQLLVCSLSALEEHVKEMEVLESELRTVVEEKLKQLKGTVGKLRKWDQALNSPNLYQRNKMGRRRAAKLIETLRTGISDIEKRMEQCVYMEFARRSLPSEPIRVASRSVAVVNTLRRFSYGMCGQRLSERKVTLMLLAFRLENTIKAFDNTIKGFEFCGSSALAAVIEERLKQLEKTAEEVGKTVWSDKLHRMWETLTLKRIDKRIGELRTGISDIDNALALAASLRSLNYVGGMVDEAAPIGSLLIGFPKQG